MKKGIVNLMSFLLDRTKFYEQLNNMHTISVLNVVAFAYKTIVSVLFSMSEKNAVKNNVIIPLHFPYTLLKIAKAVWRIFIEGKASQGFIYSYNV